MDFNALEEPMKRRLSTKDIGVANDKATKISLPLNIGQITLNDELWNPYNQDSNNQNYLFLRKTDIY